MGVQVEKNLMELQPGDVLESFADVSDLERIIGFKPTVTIEVGLARFVEWFKRYHGVS